MCYLTALPGHLLVERRQGSKDVILLQTEMYKKMKIAVIINYGLSTILFLCP